MPLNIVHCPALSNHDLRVQTMMRFGKLPATLNEIMRYAPVSSLCIGRDATINENKFKASYSNGSGHITVAYGETPEDAILSLTSLLQAPPQPGQEVPLQEHSAGDGW